VYAINILAIHYKSISYLPIKFWTFGRQPFHISKNCNLITYKSYAHYSATIAK